MQLYTALVYEGLGLVPRILAGLDALLARDGFASVAEAVGTGAARSTVRHVQRRRVAILSNS